MGIDCGEQIGAHASGNKYHQRVVVVHVHDSLSLFCLHPVKVVESVRLSLSRLVFGGSISIMAGTGIATLGNRADARSSFVPLGLAHNLLTTPSFVDRIRACMHAVRSPKMMSPVITICSISLK
jgi:hypothetical protein